VTDVDYYVNIARLAERGKFDAIFLADSHGSLRGESTRRPWRGLEPTVLLAAIDRDTERIGLVSTVHAIYGHPFAVARTIASLDHVSHGRAAWNIITSQNPPTLEALGLQGTLDPDTRYGKAQEFVEIVTGLWDSLPRSAIVHDSEHDVYIDESKTVPVDYQGQHYRTRAVLPLPGGYAGRPVLFQASASDHSRAFGARWADALFTGQRTKEPAQRFSADVKRPAAGGHRVLIGTPKQVADDIVEWVDEGASDGFNINIDVQTEGLEQFIDGVVAELQRRGRFRTEYEYETFRENLGVA
jgi:alkanesulfonate monooxygenase SsuD/methylene tetrahydromethanopterin reductase-like flavin-dependent oxidoreductase (luciferase family)